MPTPFEAYSDVVLCFLRGRFLKMGFTGMPLTMIRSGATPLSTKISRLYGVAARYQSVSGVIQLLWLTTSVITVTKGIAEPQRRLYAEAAITLAE